MVTDSGTWVLPWPAGTPRNLGTVALDSASWLPDSRHLVLSLGALAHTLTVLDTVDGGQRVIYRSTDEMMSPSVSPDGKKIAYSGGATEWNVLEISVPEGRVHTVVGGGGVVVHARTGRPPVPTFFSLLQRLVIRSIEDRSVADGFSRRVAEDPQGGFSSGAEWSPDGTQFLFAQGPDEQRLRLTVSSASGGQQTALDGAGILNDAHTWSPDGLWIAFLRFPVRQRTTGEDEACRGRHSRGSDTNVDGVAGSAYPMVRWSPKGDGIAYPTTDGISEVSPDGGAVRKLTSRKLAVYAFSKDGATVFGIVHNTSGEGAQ